MKRYVFAAGGHGKVLLSTMLASRYSVDGLFDDDPRKQGLQILGVKVLGTISDAKKRDPACGILAVGDNRTRQLMARELAGWEWLTVVHPSAYVHPSVSLGPGTVVFAGAVVQPDACIGAHAIINTAATVDHDCSIGDFVHIAPGAHLAGNVTIREGVLVGMGSVLLPGIKVGAWAVVGAGAVVVNNLPPRVTAVGAPARPVKSAQDGTEP